MLQRSLPSIAAFLLAAAALAGSAGAQGRVLFVDDDAPDADFTKLSDAVAAASDGDTIVIGTGTYGPAIVDGKSLRITAGVQEIVFVQGIEIRGVPAGGSVLVRSVRLQGFDRDALTIADCAGTVWVEGGTLEAADQTATSGARRAARVASSGSVVLARCDFRSGEGISGEGAPAVDAVDARVSLTESILRGGKSGDAPPAAGPAGVRGAPGLRVAGASFVFASGCELIGGDGGAGAPGGVGGDSASVGAGSEVRLVDCVFIPGWGGPTLSGGVAPDGEPVSGSGSWSFDPEPNRALDVPSPAPELGSIPFLFVGAGGDLLFALVAPEPSAVSYVDALHGALVLDLGAVVVLSFGSIPGATEAAFVDVAMPGLPAGVAAATLWMQPVFVRPDLASVAIGSPSALTIVDAVP